MPVATHRLAPGLMHHSDRGSQCASDAYSELPRRHGVVPSMSRPGNCYNNARMESHWATRKGELIGDHLFATHAGGQERVLLLHRNLPQPRAAPRRT